jgi:hypothetical protein
MRRDGLRNGAKSVGLVWISINPQSVSTALWNWRASHGGGSRSSRASNSREHLHYPDAGFSICWVTD